MQLAIRTQEAMVDIHLDPVLHESCALDIRRLCAEVPPGQSRSQSCLSRPCILSERQGVIQNEISREEILMKEEEKRIGVEQARISHVLYF